MADHEAALTELCTNPDTSDEEAEQCVLDFLQGGYYADSRCAATQSRHHETIIYKDRHQALGGKLTIVTFGILSTGSYNEGNAKH